MKKQIFFTVSLLLITSLIISSTLTVSNTSNNDIYSAALPVIDFSNPQNESTVGDIVSLILEAENEDEITDYEIYIDDVLVSSNNSYQWYTVNETAGAHLIKGRAKNDNDEWGEVTYSLIVDPNYNSGAFNLLNYNILEAGRNPEWMEVVKETNPEIIVLVETGDLGNNNENMDNLLGQLNAFFPDEDPYEGYATKAVSVTDGQAVLSRYPIISVNQIPTLYLDDGTIREAAHDFVEAVVEIGEMQIHIIGTHLSCCDGGEVKRALDMEGIINYMDDLGSVPIIYTGDMNSFSPFDVGDLAPVPGNLGIEPICMLLLEDDPHASTVHKFKDVYRELNPRDPGFSYIDPFYQSRIDYTFVNSYFFGSLVNSTVITPEIVAAASTGSDHFAVDATFNMDHRTSDFRPPFDPSEMYATIIDSSNVSLSWAENQEDDLSYYTVYRDGVKIGESITESYNDSGLSTSVVYEYRTTATDINGNEGTKSKKLLIDTSYGILTKTSAPILTVEFGDGQAILNWTIENYGGLPVIEFIIYRGLVLDGMVREFASTTDMFYIDHTARNGKTYYYQIVAINRAGKSEISEKIGGTLPEVTSDDTPFFDGSFNGFVSLMSFMVILPILRRKAIKR